MRKGVVISTARVNVWRFLKRGGDFFRAELRSLAKSQTHGASLVGTFPSTFQAKGHFLQGGHGGTASSFQVSGTESSSRGAKAFEVRRLRQLELLQPTSAKGPKRLFALSRRLSGPGAELWGVALRPPD